MRGGYREEGGKGISRKKTHKIFPLLSPFDPSSLPSTIIIIRTQLQTPSSSIESTLRSAQCSSASVHNLADSSLFRDLSQSPTVPSGYFNFKFPSSLLSALFQHSNTPS
ncbi:unnamed protein product [Vicia faba]|uniref:Uncharacterized protein n=1 Tax=Vicia faba TaxID=3906 RepID=A0AAV1AU68_VICFA|nr:unnamed protein product [Vicia faba]